MEHFREGDLIVVRLDKGEDLVSSLLAALKAEGARGAVMVTALGALEAVELGYFRPSTKVYERQVFEGSHELLSMSGIVATGSEGAYQPHFHVALAGEENTAVGGHLFRAKVSVLGEFALRVVYNPSMRREKEPEFGLHALRLK